MEATDILLKELFVNQALVEEIKRRSTLVQLEAGDKILSEGSYVQTIPLVVAGRIKVMRRDESGKELLLYYIQKGESCALSIAAGLNHKKSIAFAMADEKTTLLAIPLDDVRDLLLSFPRVNDFVLHLFHQRFNEIILFIDSIAFKNVDFRLIKHLQRMREVTGLATIETTHQQLADELGTAREVISRLLKQLEKEGKIKNLRGKIELTSRL